MNFVTSILLSVVVILSGTKNLLFVTDYHMNRDYYETICENQNRPEMECHGKCQVTKKNEKTSKNFSFSHFIFEFYAPATEFTPAKTECAIFKNTKVAISYSKFWNEISRAVPNPPPNI